MRCLVTGATGFVGANLVHELVARGHQVRALVRSASNLRGLAGVDHEPVPGDVTDVASLRAALAGCDWCFHVAASYHLWMRDYRPMFRANVDGTRSVLESAGAAGCSRIVYTSTVGCLGLPAASRGPIVPADETASTTLDRMTNPYKRSKWQAEQIALKLAQHGLPIVIVNPTAPVGPRDVKPTPTGQVLVDYLNRRMPGYVDTGLNWVHVRDVAVGHILAAERGRVGERYILGHATGNWTMQHTFAVCEQLSGIPAPKLRVPWAVAFAAACVDEALARVTGRPPKAPLAGVRMARYKMWFNPAKAIRELGLPQTPPEEAFREAIAWFRAHGYSPDSSRAHPICGTNA
jgi:dihydroflavonol-4-reductase